MSDVCKHGSLRRGCETCEAIARAERAEAEVVRLRDLVRQLFREAEVEARDMADEAAEDETHTALMFMRYRLARILEAISATPPTA